ncbi:MAG: disulfide oxidoreductase, partial [Sulfitobacter sp.]
VEVFVDDVAGPDVAQKVQRRLQHFIDRKVASLFEPLVALKNDEALTGLARGFAFRMVEGFGILTRAELAEEVKSLDQDARGALRKHGIRFGQFTIFMPLLLKPAPTRLRLVLWSLTKGLSEFPESPPPGLVTIPVEQGAPAGADTMSGYRNAGTRAIRIDMLERLADMLRGEDSRGGFEAKADMLSISGTTLEQFADLMRGLGYKAEAGERAKVKSVTEVMPKAAKDVAADTPVMDMNAPAEGAIIEDPSVPTAADTPEEVAAIIDEGIAPILSEPVMGGEVEAAIPEMSETETPQGTAPDAQIAGAEMETFYTFTWARPARRQQPAGGDRPKGKGKPNPRGKKGQRDGDKGNKSQNFSARPPKAEKKIDPDNPFAAALMGLKNDK